MAIQSVPPPLQVAILLISPSIANEDKQIISPSLAEGARGWVDTTYALQVKLTTASDKNAVASEYATSSLLKKLRYACFLKKLRLRLVLRANEASVAIHKSKGKDIDCHESATQNKRSEVSLVNSRNDKTSSYNVGIIDCHANASAFARNDGKAAHNTKSTLKDERLTHPPNPLVLREGA